MNRLTIKNPNGKKEILNDGRVITHFSVLTESWMICDKLGKLEDFEEELGCPLEIVFKAILNGITIATFKIDTFERPRLYYSDDCKCYRFELAYDSYYVKLQDYQKTWWLS